MSRSWDFERRRRAERFYKNVFVSSVLLVLLLGLPLSLIGLLLGIFVGIWLVLWVGLGTTGLGVIGWFVSLTSAAGIAKMDVDEALGRLTAEQDEKRKEENP